VTLDAADVVDFRNDHLRYRYVASSIDLRSCRWQYANSKLGKTAANSGHYNTFRVPFGAKGVRVTLQAPKAFLGTSLNSKRSSMYCQ